MSQFSLYLKNGEDLSHETVYRHFSFCYLESMLKDQLSKKQAVGSFENGFSGPKSFRTFREAGIWTCNTDQMTSINCCKNAIGIMELNNALQNEVVYLWFNNCTYIAYIWLYISTYTSHKHALHCHKSVFETLLLDCHKGETTHRGNLNWRFSQNF